ncbi:cytochrome P450 [Parvularcula sp. LCG005]|uniref:cytochrome P450 n=1 Tax=Parvularcula sp. LCG005 TaxID=3078805 RepID=UPI0029435DE5|nr:cytochrome P450 [Parvularcula sp. LCG005]WOI54391.1 cytochrome P450 [Parvularcula sp. LCG005]
MFRRATAALANPIALYTEDHFTEAVVPVKMGKRLFAQVMDPAMVQTLLQGEGRITGRSYIAQRVMQPALRDGLLTAEGEMWKAQRRAASPAFRAKCLAALMGTFNRAAQSSQQRLTAQANDVVDIQAEMTRASFDIIADVLWVRPGADYSSDAIVDDIQTFVTSIGRFTLSDLFPVFDRLIPRQWLAPGYHKGLEAVHRLRVLAAQIVESRKAEGAEDNDLMGLMINARDPETGDPLSPQELVDNALTFVGAGHETTANALSWTLSLLAQSPHIQDALADEATQALGGRAPTHNDLAALPLHDRVIREALRLYPPVPMIARAITGEVELGGTIFRPGDHVTVGVYPMQRHENLWEDPHRFDPDRFLPERMSTYHKYQWLPFGGGPRVCVGQRFAMMSMMSVLSHLTPVMRFEMVDERAPEPHLSLTLRPRTPLRLRVTTR